MSVELKYQRNAAVRINQDCHVFEKLQNSNPYVCGTDEMFSNPIQMDNHVSVNHAETASKCCHCSKIFADTKLLKSHIQAKHKLQYCRCLFCNIPNENCRHHLKALSGRYTCPYCHTCFYKWKDLSVHMSTHEKAMRCKICGKKFSTRWLMRQHLTYEHPGDKENRLASHCSTGIKNQAAAKVRTILEKYLFFYTFIFFNFKIVFSPIFFVSV